MDGTTRLTWLSLSSLICKTEAMKPTVRVVGMGGGGNQTAQVKYLAEKDKIISTTTPLTHARPVSVQQAGLPGSFLWGRVICTPLQSALGVLASYVTQPPELEYTRCLFIVCRSPTRRPLSEQQELTRSVSHSMPSTQNGPPSAR